MCVWVCVCVTQGDGIEGSGDTSETSINTSAADAASAAALATLGWRAAAAVAAADGVSVGGAGGGAAAAAQHSSVAARQALVGALRSEVARLCSLRDARNRASAALTALQSRVAAVTTPEDEPGTCLVMQPYQQATLTQEYQALVLVHVSVCPASV